LYEGVLGKPPVGVRCTMTKTDLKQQNHWKKNLCFAAPSISVTNVNSVTLLPLCINEKCCNDKNVEVPLQEESGQKMAKTTTTTDGNLLIKVYLMADSRWQIKDGRW
jgi:hypothetical protein